MRLRPEMYGGELAALIENYRRLLSEKDDARDAYEAAQQEIKDATEAGLVATVSAKLAGEDVSESSRIAEAEVHLRAAEYDFQASTQALTVATDRMGVEAKGGDYMPALEEAEAPLREEAVAALEGLEAVLEKIAEVRGHREWLNHPTKGMNVLEVIPRDLRFESASVSHPNGDPPTSRDLTRPLREALLGERPARTQQEWGFPVGYRMAGPWGVAEPVAGAPVSDGAARAFDELAGSQMEIVRLPQSSVPPPPGSGDEEGVPA